MAEAIHGAFFTVEELMRGTWSNRCSIVANPSRAERQFPLPAAAECRKSSVQISETCQDRRRYIHPRCRHVVFVSSVQWRFRPVTFENDGAIRFPLNKLDGRGTRVVVDDLPSTPSHCKVTLNVNRAVHVREYPGEARAASFV